ncbi:hypothetical protein Shyhy02_12050 [Streptomyces hygroscopicus subsp. hygroscopicus]|nr:hypothetical protein Shyhy02_12050 [Streptomyces hygroscopicus subsp. hygroscopicus]
MLTVVHRSFRHGSGTPVAPSLVNDCRTQRTGEEFPVTVRRHLLGVLPLIASCEEIVAQAAYMAHQGFSAVNSVRRVVRKLLRGGTLLTC